MQGCGCPTGLRRLPSGPAVFLGALHSKKGRAGATNSLHVFRLFSHSCRVTHCAPKYAPAGCRIISKTGMVGRKPDVAGPTQTVFKQRRLDQPKGQRNQNVWATLPEILRRRRPAGAVEITPLRNGSRPKRTGHPAGCADSDVARQGREAAHRRGAFQDRATCHLSAERAPEKSAQGRKDAGGTVFGRDVVAGCLTGRWHRQAARGLRNDRGAEHPQDRAPAGSDAGGGGTP